MVVKDDRREHVPVLGDRQRRHFQLDRFVQQLVDPAGAVEKRELSMKVEMNEFSAHSTVFTETSHEDTEDTESSNVGLRVLRASVLRDVIPIRLWTAASS
jgi:hypothetical protein